MTPPIEIALKSLLRISQVLARGESVEREIAGELAVLIMKYSQIEIDKLPKKAK